MKYCGYHFGIRGEVIWLGHICAGLLFLILAILYFVYNDKAETSQDKTQNNPDLKTSRDIAKTSAFIMLLLGACLVAYHSHIYYSESISPNNNTMLSTLL